MKCRKKVDLITTKNTNWQYNSQKMCIFAIGSYEKSVIYWK